MPSAPARSSARSRRATRPHGDPPPVVYTADIFDEEALALAVEKGIHVNCGSPDMIDQFGSAAPGRDITLRINPGFGHGHSQKTNTGGDHSKHGIWHEQLREVLAHAARHGLTITGAAHAHRLGHRPGAPVAGLRGDGAFARGRSAPRSRRSAPAAACRSPTGPTSNSSTIAAYHRLWDATRKRLVEAWGHPVRLEIEPGRYLVAESGYLLTQIRAIKQTPASTFYILDAGFNNLARPILYGAYHPMSIAPDDGASETAAARCGRGGPLCESGDVFTQEDGGVVCSRQLPVAQVGEWLVIERAGAYGFAMSSNYNSKPFAPEVLVVANTPHLVRARQTFKDLIRGERIPDFKYGQAFSHERLRYLTVLTLGFRRSEYLEQAAAARSTTAPSPIGSCPTGGCRIDKRPGYGERVILQFAVCRLELLLLTFLELPRRLLGQLVRAGFLNLRR